MEWLRRLLWHCEHPHRRDKCLGCVETLLLLVSWQLHATTILRNRTPGLFLCGLPAFACFILYCSFKRFKQSGKILKFVD